MLPKNCAEFVKDELSAGTLGVTYVVVGLRAELERPVASDNREARSVDGVLRIDRTTGVGDNVLGVIHCAVDIQRRAGARFDKPCIVDVGAAKNVVGL